MRVGCHVSISPNIYLAADRAARLGCEAFQIFATNPRSWSSPPIKEEEASELASRRRAYNLSPLVVHASYLINLASPDEVTQDKSIRLLEATLLRANQLGADFLVLHPGSHLGQGVEAGIKRIAAALGGLASKIGPGLKVLLENMAGSGGSIGADLSELKEILLKLDNDPRFGVCYDTAHGFAAGYDIASLDGVKKTIDEMDQTIGLANLNLIHANDSKTPLGSRIDRHENIGSGQIGLEGFANFLNHPAVRGLDSILETPKKGDDNDLANLAAIRSVLK